MGTFFFHIRDLSFYFFSLCNSDLPDVKTTNYTQTPTYLHAHVIPLKICEEDFLESVEITNKMHPVIEFIISKFIEG